MEKCIIDEKLKEQIDNEGDFEFWIDGDYICVIARMGEYGHLNGYVGLPEKHKYFGKEYDDIDIEVHGGLAFAGGKIGYYKDKDRWWIGFDTAHSCDLSPRLQIAELFKDAVYRDKGYVTSQIRGMIEQLNKKEINLEYIPPFVWTDTKPDSSNYRIINLVVDRINNIIQYLKEK